MKKLTLILFLFSSFIGYSQKDSVKIRQKEKKSLKTSVVNSKRDSLPNSTQAQDWNSSRSNKTSKTARTSNPNGNTNNNNPPNSTQAQDWNSSRSNKTSKTARTSNPNGNTNNNNPPNSTQAQDWNSTRSNKTSKTARTSNPNNDNSLSNTNRIRKSTSIGKWSTISLSSGITTPSSNFSDNAYAEDGTYFELSGAYYFSKFGIGVSAGQISSPTNENFSDITNAIGLSTTNATQNWKQFFYGIGPEYKATFGNFSATFSTKIGLQSVKAMNLESNYTNGETPIAILKIKSDKNTSLSYYSTGLKFGYSLSSNFSLFATANYMSAFSNGITISNSTISDTNKNGIIDAEDLKFATGSATIDYETSTQNIKPQSTNFGIGLRYSFSSSKSGYDYSHRLTRGSKSANQNNTKRKRPGRTKYSNITLKRNPIYEGDTQTGENPLYEGKNKVTKTLTNPEKTNDTLTKRKRPGRTKYSNITLKRSQTNENENDDTTSARKGKRKARKKCIKNGGSFWESGDGSYHCMMTLSTAKEDVNSSNELFRSKKRKCFKAGGQWVTNSHGSFCWNPKKTNNNNRN